VSGGEVVPVIGWVSNVALEVEDQDRTLAFWTEQMGFQLVQDALYEEEQWLEVGTPDQAVVLVLRYARGKRPTRPRPSLPTSNVMLYAEDPQQTYEKLTAGLHLAGRQDARHAAGRLAPGRPAQRFGYLIGTAWPTRPAGQAGLGRAPQPPRVHTARTRGVSGEIAHLGVACRKTSDQRPTTRALQPRILSTTGVGGSVACRGLGLVARRSRRSDAQGPHERLEQSVARPGS
jgi:Glyoxalase/Bleomycin resistance protein/Dioxygenase superfamily